MVASLAIAAVLVDMVHTDSVGAGGRRTVVGVHLAAVSLVASLAVARVSEVFIDASSEFAVVLFAVININ